MKPGDRVKIKNHDKVPDSPLNYVTIFSVLGDWVHLVGIERIVHISTLVKGSFDDQPPEPSKQESPQEGAILRCGINMPWLSSKRIPSEEIK